MLMWSASSTVRVPPRIAASPCDGSASPTCGRRDAAWFTRLSGLRTIGACGCRSQGSHSACTGDPQRSGAGDPRRQASLIARAARAQDADVVAIPRASTTVNLTRRLLDLNVAVLVAPGVDRVAPWRGRLGIGYDASRDADAAFAAARAILEHARGLFAGVEVAYVDTSASAAAEADADVLDQRRTAMIEWWLTERVQQLPAPVRALRLLGEPADALASFSADVDLLVIGSRGRAPLRRALTGSVSRELIARTECPLLVVPSGNEHSAALRTVAG
jgi:nucleotide-binding universal stress UspA family protein